MAGAAARFADVPWLEPVALVGAMARAARISDAARARMKPWVAAAEARYRVARELRDPESRTVALALLREAAFFALCALAVEAEDGAPPRSPGLAWEGFAPQAQAKANRPSEAELALVRAAFSAEEPLALEAVPSREANPLRLAAESTVAWLLALAEIRAPKELARARVVRVVLSAVAALAVLACLIAYGLALASIAPH